MTPAIGQRWRRKTPVDDEWDRIELAGLYELEPRSPNEWVVRPVDGLDCVSVTAADLASVFTLEADPPAAPEPELGINAAGAWVA